MAGPNAFQEELVDQPQMEQQPQWTAEDYRISWINHNRALLDQDYLNWVKGHIDYNTQYVGANPAEA